MGATLSYCAAFSSVDYLIWIQQILFGNLTLNFQGHVFNLLNQQWSHCHETKDENIVWT